MKGAYRLGRVAGVDIFVHWTFLLLLAWVAGNQFTEGGVTGALRSMALILAVFFCVVLHEFGHALAARLFGVPTKDITLLPIGGVARMERTPRDPRQELAIALAGPMVNVLIATLLLAGIWFLGDPAHLLSAGAGNLPFVVMLLWFNVVVVFFNMLPAFPMDGGRVLRALLAMRMNYLKATQVAASVGQFVAVAFVVIGLMSNWMLALVGVFVYLGAQGEAASVRIHELAKDALVRDAMISSFATVDASDSLTVASRMLLSGSQRDFPVTRNQRVIGMIERSILLQSLQEQDHDRPVTTIMTDQVPVLQDSQPLENGIELLRIAGLSTVPVLRGDRLAGLLTSENLAEWTTVASAARPKVQGHDTAKLTTSTAAS